MHQTPTFRRLKTAIVVASLAVLASGCDEPNETCATPQPEAAASTSPTPSTPGQTSVTPKLAKTTSKPVTPSATIAPSAKPVADDDLDCDATSSCNLDADLYVKRLVIARGVEKREPVGASTTFAKSEGKRIYAFVEVGNRDELASEVSVSFRPKKGKERGDVPLRVGASPRWRTWAYTELAQSVGDWEAIVKNARGDIIGRKSFSVTELPADFDPYAEDDRAASSTTVAPGSARRAK